MAHPTQIENFAKRPKDGHRHGVEWVDNSMLSFGCSSLGYGCRFADHYCRLFGDQYRSPSHLQPPYRMEYQVGRSYPVYIAPILD